jgi:hypothetical protein
MARDLYHSHAREALEKDGWKITDDLYRMSVDDVDYEIDLGAEELVAAKKDGEIIPVEIKSFLGRSTISEFHRAVGQFVDYHVALEIFEPNRVLYLAVPKATYDTFFQKRVIQNPLKRIDAKIIVYDPVTKTIAE